jgi:hypothetical protein
MGINTYYLSEYHLLIASIIFEKLSLSSFLNLNSYLIKSLFSSNEGKTKKSNSAVSNFSSTLINKTGIVINPASLYDFK